MRKRGPRCLSCQKLARPHRYFCSDRCAAGWAEAYLSASFVSYCPQCGQAHFEDELPRLCEVCGWRTKEQSCSD